jgi:integrase
MDAACVAACLEALTFHELRHTYASGLVNAGCPLAFVAELLGHTDTRMVSKHYGHLAPNALADAVRTLAPKLGLGGAPKVATLRVASAGK